ncbi:restriction endonuclease [Streptomyces sp. NPDC096012]|uniref:restriction endonuclease n=1 Tax=Streptomyces sp. NPDC096012 TaxID=3155684 RepID=UPI00336A9CD5
MTIPVRPVRPLRHDRRFDLLATTFFFLLLAIALCVLVFVARTAAGVAERRPVWAGVLVVLGVATAVTLRSRWRRFSAARCARRAALALEEAAEKASDSLRTATHDLAVRPAPGDVERTTSLGWVPEPTAPAPAPAAHEQATAEYTGLTADGFEQATAAYTELTTDGIEQTTAAYTELTTDGIEQTTAEYTELIADDIEQATAAYTEAEQAVYEYRQVAAEYSELDPDGFEQAVADLCVRDHCQDVEVVGGAGDLGADVTAVTPDGRRVVIQCKRYAEDNKVGSQDMQRFGGTCFTVHGADVAVLVTTSDFTAPALDYAGRSGILCVNGEELQAWCDGTGPSPWDLTEISP